MLIKTKTLYLAILRLVSAPSRLKKHVALPQKILLACNITTYDVTWKRGLMATIFPANLEKK